jgi:hypothetical protein
MKKGTKNNFYFALKHFIKYRCKICGKLISNCGFAYTKHEEMHEREKRAKEGDK